MTEDTREGSSGGSEDSSGIERRGYLGMLAGLGVFGVASGTAAGSAASDSLRVGNTTLRSDSNGFQIDLATDLSSKALNIVAGHPDNEARDTVGGVVAGGGQAIVDPSGEIVGLNSVTSDYCTVSGGYDNTAGDGTGSGRYATVGGGTGNTAVGKFATIGGGDGNSAAGKLATVGGGHINAGGGTHATVGGGEDNVASAENATVGGGFTNWAAGEGATVPGGVANDAWGRFSFAAGKYARAADDWSFVWNDGSGEDDAWGSSGDKFSSSTDDGLSDVAGSATFNVKATDGARFVTATDNSTVTWISADSAGWSNACSRAVKTDLDPVDPEEVLEGVESLSIGTWEYENGDGEGLGTRHMGPMAEDFHAEFDLGDSEQGINSVNADGVAFAAIQGLSRRLDEKDARIDDQADRIDALEAENDRLRDRLAALEDRVEAVAPAGDRGTPADD